jgi:MurNAc alpha-1-phosphate uridylyltransferase
MVLAAGLGTRMRPLTDTRPKVLVEVMGRPLVDHALDRMAAAGIELAVVNIHHHADLLERHLAARSGPPCVAISDERGALLDSGGGVKKALPLLGTQPFVVMNGDTLWIDGARDNLSALIAAFDARRMDILLLLAPTAGSVGYDGRGDFHLAPDGCLTRRAGNDIAPFVYAGAAVIAPTLFADTPDGAFSLNLLFDRAAATDRLHGLRLDGLWMHVGTPDAVAAAERCYAGSTA